MPKLMTDRLVDESDTLYMSRLVDFLNHYNNDSNEYKGKVLDEDKIREVSSELYRLIEKEQYTKEFNLVYALRTMIRYCYMDEVWYPQLLEKLWSIELSKSEVDIESVDNYFFIGINCLDNEKLLNEVCDKFYIWAQEYKEFDIYKFSDIHPKSFRRRINKMKALLNHNEGTFSKRNIHLQPNIKSKIGNNLISLFCEILVWAKDKNRALYFEILVSYFNINFEDSNGCMQHLTAKEQFIAEFKSSLEKDIEEASVMLGVLLSKSDVGYYHNHTKDINQMLDELFFMLYDVDKEKAKNELNRVLQKEEEFYEKYDRGGSSSWTPSYTASTDYASATLLEKLSRYDDEEVREEVAKNPNTQVDVLVYLSQDESEEVRSTVALNHNTPSTILDKLSKDNSNRVCAFVARNPNTDSVLLQRLSKYELWIRINLSWNPNLPIHLIEQLSKDRNSSVRGYIATHDKTPIEILQKLSKDKDVSVRASVASNKNTPVEVLEALSSDDGGFRLIIDSFLSGLKYRIKKLTTKGVYHIISMERVIDSCNKRNKYQVRENVASNPNTPKHVLEKLLNDKEEIVVNSAKNALNPSPSWSR